MADIASLIKALKDTAVAQYGKGAPYREALASALKGNMSGVNQALSQSELTPADFAGFVGGIKGVGKAAPFEGALKLAQERAALPVSEGGLGLHPQNTAIERANALGFDTSTKKYHGTNSDISNFDYSKTGQGQDQWGSGFYFTDRPNTASGYAKPLDVQEGGNVTPVYTKIENPLKYDALSVAMQKDYHQNPLTKKEIKSLIEKSPQLEDALWNWGDWQHEGKNKVLNEAVDAYYNPKGFSLQSLNMINNDFYNGIPKAFNENANKVIGKDALKVGFDNGETFDVMWNPSNIRSINAAFDPFKRNEADILAGVGAALPFVDYNKKK